MAIVPTQQFSFVKGQVDSHLRGRADLELYAQGAAELTNVIVRPQGGVVRRPGTRSLSVKKGNLSSQLSLSGFYKRIYKFQWSGDKLFFVEVYWSYKLTEKDNLYISIYKIEDDTITDYHSTTTSKSATENFDNFDINQLQVVQANNAMIMVHHQMAPRRIVISENTDGTYTYTIDTPTITYTSSDSEDTWPGNPHSVALHGGRLWFGGLGSQGNRVMASKTYDFFNFDTSETYDNYSIDLRLETKTEEKILHIVSARNLMLFCEESEWWCPVDILTPTNTSFIKTSTIGTYKECEPLAFGSSVIYVSYTGNTVYELRWDPRSDNYQQHVLNPHYEGLDRPKNIARMISRNYTSADLLLFVNENGTISCLSYDEQNSVAAWSTWSCGPYSKRVKFQDILVAGENTYMRLKTTLDNRWHGIRDGLGYSANKQTNLAILDHNIKLDFIYYLPPDLTKAQIAGNNWPSGMADPITQPYKMGLYFPFLEGSIYSRQGTITIHDNLDDLRADFTSLPRAYMFFGFEYETRIKTLPLAPARQGVTAIQRLKRPTIVYVHYLGTQDLRLKYAGREYVVTGQVSGRARGERNPEKKENIAEIRVLGWDNNAQIELYPILVSSEFEVLTVMVDAEVTM